MTPPDEWIGGAEAGRILDIHPSSVRNLAERGKLSVTRDSVGDRHYSRNEVEALARARGLQVTEYEPPPSGPRELVQISCPPHVNPDDYLAERGLWVGGGRDA